MRNERSPYSLQVLRSANQHWRLGRRNLYWEDWVEMNCLSGQILLRGGKPMGVKGGAMRDESEPESVLISDSVSPSFRTVIMGKEEDLWNAGDPEGAWQEWQAHGGNKGQAERDAKEMGGCLLTFGLIAALVILAFVSR